MLPASVCHHFVYTSEISEEQCLKRIPDLVRNRTVLLRQFDSFIDFSRKAHKTWRAHI